MNNIAQNFRHLPSNFDAFLSRYFTLVLVILSYTGSLALGLYYHAFFMHSPLLKFIAFFLGRIASTIAWIPAFLIAGIVCGRFHFARQVFKLYSNNDFSIAVTLTFVVLPLTLFIARRINIMRALPLYRTYVFPIALTLLILALSSVTHYLHALNNQHVYIFSCSILGAIHFLLFIITTKPRERR